MSTAFLSPELQAARLRSPTSGDPQWVQDLRAQYERKQALELSNPEGVRAREESLEAAKRRESDYLFALATGGTGAQLGAEGPRDSRNTYLRPEQTAQLLSLRAGADPAQVLTMGAAPFSAQAAPEGAAAWIRNPAVIAAAAAAAALLLVLVRRGA